MTQWGLDNMATIIDLGRQVKNKYPQYKDMSDEEVGRRVRAKYPDAYGDFEDIKPTNQVSSQKSLYQQNRGIAQKTAGFMGVEKAGQGLATTSRVASGAINQTGNNVWQLFQDQQHIIDAMHKMPLGSPQRQRLGEFLKRGMNDQPITQAEIDPGTQLSNKEVLGSFANVGLNIATPAAFKGGFGTQVAKNAALGTGFGLAGGLNDNKSARGIATSTAEGAAIGAAIPIVGKGLEKAKEAITQKLPEALMNHAVKPTLNELKKNIKTGSPTLGKELLAEGVAGSPKKLLQISDKRLNLYEDKLQTVLKNSKGVITREELKPYFEDTIKKLELTPGAKDGVTTVESLLADVPQRMDLQTANTIKRNLYDRLRDVAYKLDPKLTDTVQTMKTLARGLKTEIENKSGNPELVNQINKRLSTYGRLEDRVVDILARDNRNKLVSLTDTIAGSAGFINPLAWAGLVLKKGSESERVLTNTAKLLNKGKNIGSGAVGKATKSIIKRAALNIP